MEKEVLIGDRKFTVREILARELSEVDWNDKKAMQKLLLIKGANLTQEEFDGLTLRQLIVLTKETVDINGLDNFQETSSVESGLLPTSK